MKELEALVDFQTQLIKDLNSYIKFDVDVIVEISSPHTKFKLTKIKLKEIPDELDGYILSDAQDNGIEIFTNDIQTFHSDRYTSSQNINYIKTTIGFHEYDINLYVKETSWKCKKTVTNFG